MHFFFYHDLYILADLAHLHMAIMCQSLKCLGQMFFSIAFSCALSGQIPFLLIMK